MNNSIVICGDFIDDVAVAYKRGDFGLSPSLIFSDGTSKWFPRCEIGKFSEGLAVLEEHVPFFNGKYQSKSSVIDRKGNLVIPQSFKTIDCFSEGRAFATDEEYEKSVLIDREGNIIRSYDRVYQSEVFNEGLALLMNLEADFTVTYGFVDREGNEVIPLQYHGELNWDENYLCSEGLLRINHLGKCGYINKENEVVIPFIYDWGSRFSIGIAAVSKDGKAGFINKYNQTVIPFQYDEAETFYEGIACVKINGKWGFIDLNGRTVIPFEYDDIPGTRKYIGEEIVFGMNGKYGVMDRKLNIVVGSKYDQIWIIHPGIYHFKHSKSAGVTDRFGNEIMTDVVWGSEKYPHA